MEVLIIVVGLVTVLVIFSIITNSTESNQDKLNKGLKSIELGDYSQAIALIEPLCGLHEDAESLLLELWFKIAEEHADNVDKALSLSFLKKITDLPISKNSANLNYIAEIIEKAHLFAVEIRTQEANLLLTNHNNTEAIKHFSQISDYLNPLIKDQKFAVLHRKNCLVLVNLYEEQAFNNLKLGNITPAIEFFQKLIQQSDNFSECSEKKQNAQYQIASILYTKGIAFEKSSSFSKAVDQYEQVCEYVKKSTQTKYINLYKDAICRICICQLKENTPPNKEYIKITSEIYISSNKYRDEVLFRYAYWLTKKSEIDAALKNLSLINTSNNEVEKLKSYCQEFYIKPAIDAINTIHTIVFEDFNLEKAQNLYINYDKITDVILKTYPNLGKNIHDIKTYVFNKLIAKYFDTEKYEDLIMHICSQTNFYTQPELLKNLGIACLKLAVNQKITFNNYELVISIWLTIIYEHKVILNSLETTEWDDDYQFTLVASLGSNYRLTNIPSNVNYKDISEENISIGAVQQELINVFETALNTISNEKLASKVFSFYETEKNNLQYIISILNVDILYCNTFFAKKYDLSKSILLALSEAFNKKQEISILETGLLYYQENPSDTQSIFAIFLSAKKSMQNILSSIKNKNKNLLKSHINPTNKNSIAKIKPLKDIFEQQILNAFEEISKADNLNEEIINLYEISFELISNSQILKNACAEFIIHLSIEKMNNDKIKNEQGLHLSIKAFNLNSLNNRINKNLAVITKFNCFDLLNDNISTNAKNMLEELIRSKNSNLTSYLKSELNPIIEEFFDGMDLSLVKMLKSAIGMPISKNLGFRDFSSLDDLLHPQKTLNTEGYKLAAKLKIIYQLTI